MEYFSISETINNSPSNKHFYLHTHDNYEILLFLEGDASYVVEGRKYNLESGDIILIRKNQLHRVYHNSSARYRRIVVNITTDFFSKFNCSEYEEQFLNNSLDTDNRICSSQVKRSGILDVFSRIKAYSNNYSDLNTPVCVSAMIELLYLLNKTERFTKADNDNNYLLEIVNYMNENFTENITLDTIAKKFFVSKFYFCREFKKMTGLTFHKYINQKRFARVKTLTDSGVSISSAATLSGFNSYPSFYRAYMNEFGKNPSDGLMK